MQAAATPDPKPAAAPELRRAAVLAPGPRPVLAEARPSPAARADAPLKAAASPVKTAQFVPAPRPDGPVRTAPPEAPPKAASAAVKTAQLPAAPLAALAIVSGPIQPERPALPAGAFVAQVAATSTPQAARQALDQVTRLIGKGRAPRVEAATVGGRQVYRATVTGFATRAEAISFCGKVENGGGSCWAR
jgi:hypothetical protein